MKYLPKYPITGYLLGGKVVFTDDEKQTLHEACNEYFIPSEAFKGLYEYLNKWATKCAGIHTLKYVLQSHLWSDFYRVEQQIRRL